MKVYCWKTGSNFPAIIGKTLGKCLRIDEIKSGWTNFVFLAETENGRFVCRFPRTKFFQRAMLAEYNATKYIGRFLSVAGQELHFFGGKPFTVHKYIDGEPLSAAFARMTEKQKQNIADEILEYLAKLQSITFSPDGWERLSKFLARLAKATKNREYDFGTLTELIKSENPNNLVLCHGDFNPDNILVANNRLVCVIDYAFATISAPCADISRLCNRMPAIAKYFTPNPKLVDMWDYVDNNYIQYMKVYHKEVQTR
jgi:aminoglycoside phosphotransferase (APT) family kinase protein